jgi:hypothetical protein
MATYKSGMPVEAVGMARNPPCPSFYRQSIMFFMKSLEWFITAAVFFWMTEWCGKSIEKRNWARSVESFLLALGTLLTMVRNSPPF